MDIVYTLAELPAVAPRVLEALDGRRIVALHGDMGAGKTTFVHACCETLGVEGNVSSPTFALVNEYRTGAGETIYHMDWYRLKDEEEALQAGMEEYLYSGARCLVEWPDRAPGLLPENAAHLYLEVLDPQTRRLRV
jgi:tRNA threonylcarbamoyladenosine biosynthesis protein TsaE